MLSTSTIQVFQGGTKETVGRVFYTEGKSLVFYAYDLSALGTVSQANTPTTFGETKKQRQQSRCDARSWNVGRG